MSHNVRSREAGGTLNAVQSSGQTAPGHNNSAITCNYCHEKTLDFKLTCLSCKNNFHRKCAKFKKFEAYRIREYYCDDCYEKFNCITIWRVKKGARRQRSNKRTGIYEVEAILDHRIIDRKIQYLIKWKGGPYGQGTWEDESSCKHAPEIVNRYRRNHGLRPNVPQRKGKRKKAIVRSNENKHRNSESIDQRRNQVYRPGC